MKLQLFILSAILISALAHPVPDEEVSPVKADLPAEIKPDLTQIPAEKPLEETKTEVLATEQVNIEKKLTEKLALPENAPDAEIAQAIPDKKEEKVIIEKQTRAEDKLSGDVKSLPVVESPVAGIETDKQIIDEVKPAVQEAQPIGKNVDIVAETPAAAAPVSDQKKDELSVAEAIPAVKSETPIAAEAPVAIVEEKKEEQPARQERGTEEQVKQVLAEEAVKPAVEAPASSEVQPEIKDLLPASGQLEAVKIEEPIAPISELKSGASAVEKPAEPAPAAGDIPTPQIAQLSNIKALPTEPEKLEAVPAASTVPEAKNIEDQSAVKPLEALPEKQIDAAPIAALAGAEPLKQLEEKPAPIIEEKKSEESKESKESKESDSDSKESEESKENKSN